MDRDTQFLEFTIVVDDYVCREDLGRSTWTLLHVLAAQFPDQPTRQQRKDAFQLIDCLTRIYPCSECARHFQEIVRWGT
jgi:FAD-linked sulfhydryl oxidase